MLDKRGRDLTNFLEAGKKTRFYTGQAGANKGKKFSKEHREKISISKFKGDNAKKSAGYSRLHRSGLKKRPCDVCGVMPVDWHHKDGNPLNNDLSNIAFLCRTHHMKIDGRWNNLRNQSL